MSGCWWAGAGARASRCDGAADLRGDGYTGTLIARRAAARGVPAILGGRQADAVNALAAELGRDGARVRRRRSRGGGHGARGDHRGAQLRGPILAYRRAARRRLPARPRPLPGHHRRARRAGVARRARRRGAGRRRHAAAGAGFDVVPTDCLAAEAKHRLPTATHLALAFRPGTRMSRGTATTSIENAGGSGVVRRDGALVRVPAAGAPVASTSATAPRRRSPFPGATSRPPTTPPESRTSRSTSRCRWPCAWACASCASAARWSGRRPCSAC